jgi:hypothetical protein
VFEAANGTRIAGAENYVAALKRLAPILIRHDAKRIWADADQDCVIYDFVTDTAEGAIPSVERITMAQGRITRIELIFLTHGRPSCKNWRAAVHKRISHSGHPDPAGTKRPGGV